MNFTEATNELTKHTNRPVSPEMLGHIERTALAEGRWPTARVRIAFFVVMAGMAQLMEPIGGYTDD